MDVEIEGEELTANWFGWFNRGLEASARAAGHPDALAELRVPGLSGPAAARCHGARAAAAGRSVLQPAADRPPTVSLESEHAHGFPLFPLELVVLPTEMVPLHIFEERYKTMVGECLARDHEFGVVWLSDNGLRHIGCACRIERVLDRDDEGRMNLLTRGTRPFRVIERQGHLPYPAGVIEFLVDRGRAGRVAAAGRGTRRVRRPGPSGDRSRAKGRGVPGR